MSVTFGFYNSLNGDRKYDAIQMSSIFDGIIRDGIFMSIGECLVVKENSGLTLKVMPGRAWFNHTWTLNDANYLVRWEKGEGESYPVDLDGNDVTPETVADRIDAVILRVNEETSVRANAIGIKKGTPSTVEPQKPALTNTDTVHEYALAYVRVNHGVTEITQSDIENMVGTSGTPYVTGILDTVNIDDLIAQWKSQWNDQNRQWSQQWDDQYTADQARFDAWMLDQTIAYTDWTTTQQANFDAWFANIKDILDKNVAAKLQNEIDELKKIIKIVTEYDSSLAGATITVTNGDDETYTAVANASGITTFDGYSLGTWTISESLYGSSVELECNYHGNYVTAIGGDRFINVTYDDEFVGKVIICTDGTTTQRKTGTSGKLVKFCFMNDGVYTISSVVDDKEFTTTVRVNGAGIYNAELKYASGSYEEWLEAAGIEDTYGSLDAVLEDENALRILFTKHASVDYLVDWSQSDEDTTDYILENDLVAKWVNLKDYAFETLYHGTYTKPIMVQCEKYGYGEWVEKDGTWGPKGNVPKMTSNTEPYGEAFGSSLYSTNKYYYAFDNDADTKWLPNTTTASNEYIGYKFINPICVRKISITQDEAGGWTTKLQYSDDGITYHDTNLVISVTSRLNNEMYKVDDYGYHMYWRMTGIGTGRLRFNKLQFYGREMKVSVPKMTSNTAPSGIAFSKSDDGSHPAYYSFDKNLTTYSSGYQVQSDWYIGYIFNKPIVAKLLSIYQAIGDRMKSYRIEGSNDTITGLDGTWEDLTGSLSFSGYGTFNLINLNDQSEYKAYRLYVISSTDSPCLNIDFYGFDYSESLDETITVDIKSAVNDTVYYYDENGNKTTLCVTDSSGNSTGVSITYTPGENITLYSTIAKSTEDVSKPYSKTLALNNSVTSISLIPDGAVYWYGLELHAFIEFKYGSTTISKQTNSFYLSANGANAYGYVNFQPWGEGITSGLRVKYYADHTSGIMSDSSGKNPKVQVNYAYGSYSHRIFYGNLTEVTGYNSTTVYAIWTY